MNAFRVEERFEMHSKRTAISIQGYKPFLSSILNTISQTPNKALCRNTQQPFPINIHWLNIPNALWLSDAPELLQRSLQLHYRPHNIPRRTHSLGLLINSKLIWWHKVVKGKIPVAIFGPAIVRIP